MAEMAVKHDQDKPQVDLLDPQFILGMAKIMTFGAKKYGRHNWQQGIEPHRLYSAAMRHMLQNHAGETLDKESGMSHLYHAACNLMMMAYYTVPREEISNVEHI